jgi:hypothetical protein
LIDHNSIPYKTNKTTTHTPGHYIASVKKYTAAESSDHPLTSSSSSTSRGGSDWVQFDDSVSMTMSPTSVVNAASSDGYILFFTTTMT